MQCCGSGMFIPDPDFCPSRIPDLESRIQKHQQKRRVKKLMSYLATNTTKLKILELFTQKSVIKHWKIWVWDPGSGKTLFRIPGSKKEPDPGIRNRDCRYDRVKNRYSYGTLCVEWCSFRSLVQELIYLADLMGSHISVGRVQNPFIPAIQIYIQLFFGLVRIRILFFRACRLTRPNLKKYVFLIMQCCGSGSVFAWSRIDLVFLDLELYWDFGSGSRSKEIDKNLKRNLDSSLSQRRMCLSRIFLWPITYTALFWIRILSRGIRKVWSGSEKIFPDPQHWNI